MRLLRYVKALPCLTVALTGSKALTAPATEAPKSTTSPMANSEARKIAGQMTLISLSELVDGTKLNVTKATAFAKLNVGFIFGGVQKAVENKFNLNVAQWRRLVTDIQAIWNKEGAPPVVFGNVPVRGASFVRGALMLSAPINQGATMNRELVYKAGKLAAEEWLAAGVNLFFGPNADIVAEKIWGRFGESFAECPYIVKELVTVMVKALQSSNKTSACLKHFIGTSHPKFGFDGTHVELSAFAMKNYYAVPFMAAINAGVKCITEAYVSINQVPVHESTMYIDEILRKTLNFKELVVGEYRAIGQLNEYHRTARTPQLAAERALDTSFDLNMESTSTDFIEYADQAINMKTIPLSRLQETMKRIEQFKTDLNLYKEAVPGAEFVKSFRSKEHIKVALDLAEESIIMLKNKNNILPLNRKQKIFVTGAAADDIGIQCGPWCISWQGEKEDNSLFENGISFSAGIKAYNNNTVTYAGLYVNGSHEDGHIAKAMKFAASADVIVMTLAEAPAAGADATNTYDMSFNAEQLRYANELLKSKKPMILVLASNRPLLLNGLAGHVDAILDTMLIGELGGEALANILFGKSNPSGRLPFTYPKYQALSNLVYYEAVDIKCVGSEDCKSEFAFGTGLSYTTFEYSDLRLSSKSIHRKEILTVSVTVKNTGMREGMEVVMLFLKQPFRKLAVPEKEMLRGFEKILLKPGDSQIVTFKLNEEAWTAFSPDSFTDFERKFEESVFFVKIKPETTCDVYGNKSAKPNPLCAQFVVS